MRPLSPPHRRVRTDRLRTAVLTLGVAALALGSAIPAAAGPIEDGAKSLAQREYAKAADHYARALKATPGSRDAALGLARATTDGLLYARHDEANDAIVALVRANEADADAWVARGDLALLSATSSGGSSSVQLIYADAESHYMKAREIDASHVGAATGLSRVLAILGRVEDAQTTLETLIAGAPSPPAKALAALGRLHYEMALQAHRAAGGTYPVAGEARGLFGKAQAALGAAGKADPTDYDAFLYLGYASAYLQETQEAGAAYERAATIDGDRQEALRGLVSAFAHEPAKYRAALERLVKAKPDHAEGHFFLGHDLAQAGEAKRAKGCFAAAAKHGRNPGEAWYRLGLLERADGDEKAALKAFRSAVEANPQHTLAAWEWTKELREGGIAKATASLKGAREVKAGYEEVLALAPQNAGLWNDLAFILRDAHARHASEKSWREVLDASTAAYVRATEIVGPWDPTTGESLPYATRHGNAQVVSDTALMFQFYEETRDLERAEALYVQALEWSDNGYFDAYNNLAQIYTAQERWEELYDLASMAAESLKLESGEPAPQRSMAAALAKKLESEGKAGQ